VNWVDALPARARRRSTPEGREHMNGMGDLRKGRHRDGRRPGDRPRHRAVCRTRRWSFSAGVRGR
jgi:hypothetical protein